MAAIYVLLIILLSTAFAAVISTPGRQVTEGLIPNRPSGPDARGDGRVRAARTAQR